MASAETTSSSPYAHLVDADYYQNVGYPHDAWRELRQKPSIHWIERDVGDSYWAVTRHAEITAVGRQPEVFSSEIPVLALEVAHLEALQLLRAHGPAPEHESAFRIDGQLIA